MRTALRTLGFFLAASTGLDAQDSVDPFDDAVAKAVTHGRYAVRRAAAGKLARAGDEAVPAIRRHVAANGRDSLPLELVDALAQADGRGPAIEALLTEWATDRRFYWRSQALAGLARRGVAAARPLFDEALDDPSHLYRIEGARGLLAVASADDEDVTARVRARLQDADPRVRLRVALMLLERGDGGGAEQIGEAVFGASRVFLDDRWGAREATLAVRELQRIAKLDVAAILGGNADEASAARQVLTAWIGGAAPSYVAPEVESPDSQPLFGVEVRSCRNGDLFLVAWPDGRVTTGLSPQREIKVEALEQLAPGSAVDGIATHGAVICDFVRVYVPSTPGEPPRAHHKAAPGSVPPPVLEWLKMLAASLDETEVGEPLSVRLGQFAPSDD
jgi:hypothetical protein